MRQVNHYRPDSVWNLLSEVERAFGEVSGTRAAAPRVETFTPAVDVFESSDNYLVSVDLPGVNEKEIKIDLQPGRLVVSGERTRTHQASQEGYSRFERNYGAFERTFALPQDVRGEEIQARFENGVLEILVPKVEVAKSRAIQINKEKGGLFSRLLHQKDVVAKTDAAESH